MLNQCVCLHSEKKVCATVSPSILLTTFMRHLELLAVFAQGLCLSASLKKQQHISAGVCTTLLKSSALQKLVGHQRTGELVQTVTFGSSRNKMLYLRHTAQVSQHSTGRESLFWTRMTLKNTLMKAGAAPVVHSRTRERSRFPSGGLLSQPSVSEGHGPAAAAITVRASGRAARYTRAEQALPASCACLTLLRSRNLHRAPLLSPSPQRRPGSAPRAECPRAPAPPALLPPPSRHRTRSSPPALHRLSR